jgi:endogenous inhibitor of DNA gyrase (YacG/DUF329 family)
MMSASPPANDNAKTKTAPGCAICGRPRVEKYSPFCSRRCADVDLYRWLNGKYAIPAGEDADEQERIPDAAPEEDD